ncbi:MAG: hypothetical protein WC827_03640 [Candidatus Paceibacterota bacterium]|jgi:hypothetical protein
MKEINIIKPIELTPEQKEELIELCNKTWPIFPWKFRVDRDVNDNFGKDSDYPDSDYLGYSTFTNWDCYCPFLDIHWFEFVVRMAVDGERDEFMNFYLNVCSPDETSANK